MILCHAWSHKLLYTSVHTSANTVYPCTVFVCSLRITLAPLGVARSPFLVRGEISPIYLRYAVDIGHARCRVPCMPNIHRISNAQLSLPLACGYALGSVPGMHVYGSANVSTHPVHCGVRGLCTSLLCWRSDKLRFATRERSVHGVMAPMVVRPTYSTLRLGACRCWSRMRGSGEALGL